MIELILFDSLLSYESNNLERVYYMYYSCSCSNLNLIVLGLPI